jgi:hypothetical protein
MVNPVTETWEVVTTMPLSLPAALMTAPIPIRRSRRVTDTSAW